KPDTGSISDSLRSSLHTSRQRCRLPDGHIARCGLVIRRLLRDARESTFLRRSKLARYLAETKIDLTANQFSRLVNAHGQQMLVAFTGFIQPSAIDELEAQRALRGASDQRHARLVA